MNLLKKYKEQIEVGIALSVIPAFVLVAQVLDLCKHC